MPPVHSRELASRSNERLAGRFDHAGSDVVAVLPQKPVVHHPGPLLQVGESLARVSADGFERRAELLAEVLHQRLAAPFPEDALEPLVVRSAFARTGKRFEKRMKVAAGVDEVQRPYRAAFPEGVFPYPLDPRRPVADELDAPDLADSPAPGEHVHDGLELVARAGAGEVPHVTAPHDRASVPVDVVVEGDRHDLDLPRPRLVAVLPPDALGVGMRAGRARSVHEHGHRRADFAGVLRELAGGEDPRVLHQRVRHPRGPGLLRRVPRDRRHRRDGDVQSEVLLQERPRVPEGVELRAGLGDDAPRLRCRARLPRLASELRESLAGHAAPRRVRVPERDAPAAREHAGCPVAHGPGFLEGLRDGRRHRGHLRLRVRPERLGDADVQVGGGGVRRPLLEFGYDRRDVGAADADVQREEFFLEPPSRFSATAAASNRAMSFRIPLYLPVSSRTLA